MKDVDNGTSTPSEVPSAPPKEDITQRGVSSVRGRDVIGSSEVDDISINQDKVNDLLSKDPETTSPQEGIDNHRVIQNELIEKGKYKESEVAAKNQHGEVAKRNRVVTRGPNAGEEKEEGTVYDLFTETDKTIETGEIKPFSPTGVLDAKQKFELQKDIEKNHDGNHGGKQIERKVFFYDPRDASVIISGPADKTIEKANEMASKWGKES